MKPGLLFGLIHNLGSRQNTKNVLFIQEVLEILGKT